MLDNEKVLEQLQKLTSDVNNADLNNSGRKLEHKRHLMTSEKGIFVQHRREYYNDFEDCIRDYKNAKIKSLQKQTKIHLSDGDNGESDSDYVDCNDSSDLKLQSSLTSKSMPHVCQQLELKETAKETKRIEAEAPKAQLNTNYDVLKVAHKPSAQLPPHKNNLNQIINVSSTASIKIDEKLKERKLSIHTETSSSTIDVHVNQKPSPPHSPPETASEVVKPTPVQTIVKKDEVAKRKSCKKKQNGESKDPTHR